jgi:hypothetical protein
MQSGFAWVDFDDASRRRMLDLIETFRDQNTLDELGIGTIRDAFANYFFPGTSTIQTRARYFLFIPWTYLRLESKSVASAKILSSAREDEFKLIDSLIRSGIGENEGIIGRISGRKLQRLPSNIYWAGLYTWGMRRFPGTQEQYHRYLDYYYKKKSTRLITDDKEPIDGHMDFNWDPSLPDAPADFPEGATMNLNRRESKYLQNRIAELHGETLLCLMINAESYIRTDYFWQNNKLINTLPESLQRMTVYAKDFAHVIHGAVLLYNLMLSQKQNNQELEGAYRNGIQHWIEIVTEQKNSLHNWYADIKSFWGCGAVRAGNVGLPTKKFVDDWCSLVFGSSLKTISENEHARNLIKKRECDLKKNRARLENQRYLELWKGMPEISMIDYRWRQVSRIIQDIRQGLGIES